MTSEPKNRNNFHNGFADALSIVMTGWVLTLVVATTLFAADDQQLALVLKAQTDFDRVELSATPQLREAGACVQSQAGLVPVTAPEELALVHYRKGYCMLVAASNSNDQRGYLAAAAEFDQAVDSWPPAISEWREERAPAGTGIIGLTSVSCHRPSPRRYGQSGDGAGATRNHHRRPIRHMCFDYHAN